MRNLLGQLQQRGIQQLKIGRVLFKSDFMSYGFKSFFGQDRAVIDSLRKLPQVRSAFAQAGGQFAVLQIRKLPDSL